MAGEKLPARYQRIRKENKKFFNAVERLGKVAKEEGPLNEKTSHLIQLAAATAIRSEGAVHSHTRRALKAGAKPEEIRHSLRILTSTIGFPTVAAALSWAEDVMP
jgi:4-carboxymuconolactone decarboxylase